MLDITKAAPCPRMTHTSNPLCSYRPHSSCSPTSHAQLTPAPPFQNAPSALISSRFTNSHSDSYLFRCWRGTAAFGEAEGGSLLVCSSEKKKCYFHFQTEHLSQEVHNWRCCEPKGWLTVDRRKCQNLVVGTVTQQMCSVKEKKSQSGCRFWPRLHTLRWAKWKGVQENMNSMKYRDTSQKAPQHTLLESLWAARHRTKTKKILQEQSFDRREPYVNSEPLSYCCYIA